jgi:uncharacterized protein
MDLNFQPVGLERQHDYAALYADCGAKPSDYSFLNLWGWAEEHGLEWAWQKNLVWIRQTRPDLVYWAPVGAWDRVDWSRHLNEDFREETVFDRVPEALCDLWKEAMGPRLAWEAAREHWDYLYAVRELTELKGKRFHKKKNLLNQFKKRYPFQYRVFDSTMTERALGMQEDWCTWRDCESSEALAAENRVITRVLEKWDDLPGIMGGALMVEQRMAAYTIAERLSDDTVLIHFEKGNPEFKGVYQAINQMFLDGSGAGATTVNREQDLGDEGLRKAKLSYNPVGFVEKYRVVLK